MTSLTKLAWEVKCGTAQRQCHSSSCSIKHVAFEAIEQLVLGYFHKFKCFHVLYAQWLHVT